MFIVALVFSIIFLFRDVQILPVPSRRLLAARFGVYATLLLTGMVIFAASAVGRASWMERWFALAAVVAQALELLIGFALQRYALGRYSWFGCILPSPSFLMALCALSFEVQNKLLHVGTFMAIAIVMASWLLIVGGLVSALCWMNNPWEDQRFASDFALMTSCTALIFVPFGLA